MWSVESRKLQILGFHEIGIDDVGELGGGIGLGWALNILLYLAYSEMLSRYLS